MGLQVSHEVTAATVKAANEALALLRDKGARWWRYCVSHRTFDLVVGDATGEANVALCLLVCQHISGPVAWARQRLEVVWDPEAPSVFILEDQVAGFRAKGYMFLWKPNWNLIEKKTVSPD